MVFNATINNISVISRWSVLLVEETGEPRENHQPAASHWNLYHIILYTSPWSKFELTTSVVIGTDCICSFKSNLIAFVVLNPTTIRSRPRRPLIKLCIIFGQVNHKGVVKQGFNLTTNYSRSLPTSVCLPFLKWNSVIIGGVVSLDSNIYLSLWICESDLIRGGLLNYKETALSDQSLPI